MQENEIPKCIFIPSKDLQEKIIKGLVKCKNVQDMIVSFNLI